MTENKNKKKEKFKQKLGKLFNIIKLNNGSVTQKLAEFCIEEGITERAMRDNYLRLLLLSGRINKQELGDYAQKFRGI